MHFFILYLSLGLNINLINFPFDRGSNMQGSNRAPAVINRDLKFLNIVNIVNNYTIDCRLNHLRTVFGQGYFKVRETINMDLFPFIIGGDHTISVSTISACNDYCISNKNKLGVLWCDAHADFNTIQTSPSGNLHGTPVSILCGHTLPVLSFGENLSPEQFAYFGLRDLDCLEFDRFQDYNMKSFDTETEIVEWIKNYDKIYVSLDLDVIDPDEFNSINTPVKNGISIKRLHNILEIVKNSGKLFGMDIVEYNPDKGEDTSVITNIIKHILT